MFKKNRNENGHPLKEEYDIECNVSLSKKVYK